MINRGGLGPKLSLCFFPFLSSVGLDMHPQPLGSTTAHRRAGRGAGTGHRLCPLWLRRPRHLEGLQICPRRNRQAGEAALNGAALRARCELERDAGKAGFLQERLAVSPGVALTVPSAFSHSVQLTVAAGEPPAGTQTSRSLMPGRAQPSRATDHVPRAAAGQ